LKPYIYPGDSGAISNHETESPRRGFKNQTLVLALGALGVVYGDIGTSPLYAIRECFHGHHAIALTQGNVFGVMQRPNVPEIMKLASDLGLPIDEAGTTYYLGRVSLFTTGDSKMMRWRKVLFAFMSRNAGTPAAYFGLPANRVVELGAQIQL
jgi:K+ transporter